MTLPIELLIKLGLATEVDHDRSRALCLYVRLCLPGSRSYWIVTSVSRGGQWDNKPYPK